MTVQLNKNLRPSDINTETAKILDELTFKASTDKWMFKGGFDTIIVNQLQFDLLEAMSKWYNEKPEQPFEVYWQTAEKIIAEAIAEHNEYPECNGIEGYDQPDTYFGQALITLGTQKGA